MFVFLLSGKISHVQYLFWGGKYTVNTRLIPRRHFEWFLFRKFVRLAFSSNRFCEQHSLLSRAQKKPASRDLPEMLVNTPKLLKKDLLIGSQNKNA